MSKGFTIVALLSVFVFGVAKAESPESKVMTWAQKERQRLMVSEDKSSNLYQFAKSQLEEKLARRGLRLAEDSLTVRQNLAYLGFNTMVSVMNVEYQFYPHLKTFNVEFSIVDQAGNRSQGYTYIKQVACNPEKKAVDCDQLATQREFGVFSEGAGDSKVAMVLMNHPLSVEVEEIDLHLTRQ